jgi:hypothetical protein
VRSFLKLAFIVVALGAACTGCGSRGAPPDPVEPQTQAADAVVVVEQCQPVTSIEVVHRVGGVPVTDRVRVADAAGADPAQAMQTFQVVADHFGADTIVSSRAITEVHCFSAAPAAAQARVAPLDATGLCADPTGIIPCNDPTPSHSYPYDDGGSCTIADLGQAVSMSCDDSSAILSRRGDVVVTMNTQAIKSEVLARTQALRRLLGDQNVIANFHFSVFLSPGQQAALVGNEAFNNIAQQLHQAVDLGQPLPDIQQLLASLPQPPENVAFLEKLQEAYQIKQERLKLLAEITNGNALSPQQVNAFYQNFVGKSKTVDKLLIERTANSLGKAATIINDTIEQLATADPLSTIYQQVKAAARSLLEAQSSKGIFDPDRTVHYSPDLYKFLTDDNIDKRLLAAERLIALNETLRRGGAEGLVTATSGVLGFLAVCMQNDDWDRVWRLYDQVLATEFFFDNNDPAGTSYDVHLTPQAQAMFNVEVAPDSAVAYEVIAALNEVADYHAETGKVTVEYQAIIEINARTALSTDDAIRALYHTEESYSTLSFLKNNAPAFLAGAVKELGGLAEGVLYTAGQLLTDPGGTLDHLKAAVVNWRQTVGLIWQQGADVLHRWPNMTPEEKAELVGRLATEILLSLPAKAGQVARVEEALADAARLTMNEAEHGLAIIERGGVALAPEAAIELSKDLERIGITATDESVQIADLLDDLMPCQLVAPGAHLQLVPAAARPPCSASQIGLVIADLYEQARALGATTQAELADMVVASAKTRLRAVGDTLWESAAGLRYGPDPRFENRVRHVLNHAVDDVNREGLHGVFDAGPRGALSVVDEAWQKAMREGRSADVNIIQQGNNTRYEINMNRRVGYVGGEGGAAAGHPEARRIAIVIKNLRDVVTAFPLQ